MRRREDWKSTVGSFVTFIAFMVARVLPKSIYETLARLIPIPDIPEFFLTLALTFVIAALLYLALAGVMFIWESRSSAGAASRDAPIDDK